MASMQPLADTSVFPRIVRGGLLLLIAAVVLASVSVLLGAKPAEAVTLPPDFQDQKVADVSGG